MTIQFENNILKTTVILNDNGQERKLHHKFGNVSQGFGNPVECAKRRSCVTSEGIRFCAHDIKFLPADCAGGWTEGNRGMMLASSLVVDTPLGIKALCPIPVLHKE